MIISRLILSALAIGAFTLYSPLKANAAGQFPDPADEAALYELAKIEGEVVWYEAAPLEAMQALVGDFEKKYPGIKVQLLRISGPKQYQRYLQETMAGQHIADVMLSSDRPSLKELISDGHISEWKVPAYDRVPEVFKLGSFAYAPYTTDMAIMYNKDGVTPEEVKLLESSWKSVIDPRFKGRMAVVKRKCGVCYAGVNMFLSPEMEDEFGVEFLKAVMQQEPTVYVDNPVAMDRLIAGEHDLVFWLWEGIGFSKWKQGAPVRWARPNPTPDWGNSWLAISAHAPHPNAARLFANWLISEEGAVGIQTHYGSATTLTGMKDTRPVTEEAWYKPIDQRWNIQWERWANNYEEEMAIWQKIQSGEF